MTEITIIDLFEGAYLLTKGHHLKNVTIEGTNGKTQCLFIFTGEDVDRAAEAYRSGNATVNVAKFKFAMEAIKDRMFSSRRHYSKAHSIASGGRKGYSHARKDRTQVTY
jgi:hypothetical protein